MPIPFPAAPKEPSEKIEIIAHVASVMYTDTNITLLSISSANTPGRDVRCLMNITDLMIPGRRLAIEAGKLVRITIEHVEERDLPAYDPA